MKKLTAILMSVLLVISLAAWSSQSVLRETEEDSKSQSEQLIGDINNDGKISSADVGLANSHAKGITMLLGDMFKAADVNTDGEITSADVGMINAHVKGIRPLEGSAIPSTTEPTEQPTTEIEGKTLIVYFSWSSNTERMANTIKEQTGGDLLELMPITEYPTDYTACTEIALAERDNNARPAIQNLPASVDEYDTILIGYPIWWHTAPMIIGTFLESYDLTGVNIYPFSQSASMDTEQFNNSMNFVRECAKDADVHDGLFVRYSDTSAINLYLKNNNLSK